MSGIEPMVGAPAHVTARILDIENRMGIRHTNAAAQTASVDATDRAFSTQGADATASFDEALTRVLGTPSNLTTTHHGSSGATSEWADTFEAVGRRHGIDPALLEAVAEVESAFNPNAVSPAGAQGLMQFMPGTAADMGINPFDPAQAIDGAARYLLGNLQRFGSVELALAAYNAGPGAVEQYGGIPPYRETQDYVEKVLAAYARNSA